MPTVIVDREELFERLGWRCSDEAFDDKCFEFGVELDDIETLPTGRVVYYIAVAANRTDLLCIEGLARSLRSFFNAIPPPTYALAPTPSPLTMTVKAATKSIRPYVVCAVLRGVSFTQERYNSFIDLQDKLHNNIARRRTLVAIGTHDLDSVEAPFSYEALPPASIEFVPLSQARAFRADALMDFYRTDPSVKHIKPYVDIIAHSPVFPIIYDARRTVLSLPPIINGEHSKIGLATRNVLIECTATDLAKAHVVLNTMVTMFSEYCAEPFVIEPVRVVYEEQPSEGIAVEQLTPQLGLRSMEARLDVVRSMVGAPIEDAEAPALAARMQLHATLRPADAAGGSGAVLEVGVPPTRSDILHECDIVEDLAIAYGYNRIVRTLPRTLATGTQLPINKLSDALRQELARAGYDETLTMALCSSDDNFKHMLLEDPGNVAVTLANPKTEEFQIGRTSVIPGLLKSLHANRAASMKDGMKLFEVTDVLLLDPATDVGARNERRLAALYTGPSAGFEVIHGLVNRLMLLLEVPPRPFTWEGAAAPAVFGRGGLRYHIEHDASVPSYFPGRGARVVVTHESGRSFTAGTLGVLHPRVLQNFDLALPVAVVELCVEPFL